jgi:hypothetical protein
MRTGNQVKQEGGKMSEQYEKWIVEACENDGALWCVISRRSSFESARAIKLEEEKSDPTLGGFIAAKKRKYRIRHIVGTIEIVE